MDNVPPPLAYLRRLRRVTGEAELDIPIPPHMQASTSTCPAKPVKPRTRLAKRIQSILTTRRPYPDSPAQSEQTTPVTCDSKRIHDLCTCRVVDGERGSHRDSAWVALGKLSYLRGNNQSMTGDDSSSIMVSSPVIGGNTRTEAYLASESGCEPQAIDISDDSPEPAANSSTDLNGGPPTPTLRLQPSSTQITLQIMWWGYRLFLPPPVLDILGNRQLETAKRATMIVTSLEWLLTHIPSSNLPPQFKPILLLLSGLVPLIGYLGGFVAWSWSTIKSFDKGSGVTLTATWILPIALVPGTWNDDSNLSLQIATVDPEADP